VLRGWDPAGGVADHHLEYRDIRVRNVPTNVRELGGTRYNGNSIFVFEVADLCIAHLGHLHHTLTATHVAELGAIDVVMAPVDGTYTLNQEEMIEVLRQIGPKLVIPMHIFSRASLERFLAKAEGFYAVRWEPSPTLVLFRTELPENPSPRAAQQLAHADHSGLTKYPDKCYFSNNYWGNRSWRVASGGRAGSAGIPLPFRCRVRTFRVTKIF
jgi:hypothetical protein